MSVFIIAEAGVNHNGSIKTAKKLIDVAAEAGAEYVKFQTFKAETLVTKTADKAEYQKEVTVESETQFETEDIIFSIKISSFCPPAKKNLHGNFELIF